MEVENKWDVFMGFEIIKNTYIDFCPQFLAQGS